MYLNVVNFFVKSKIFAKLFCLFRRRPGRLFDQMKGVKHLVTGSL